MFSGMFMKKPDKDELKIDF
ncbi:BnaC05g26160D [Brassica napus]|uniref:BnaC05g26160D protein n=1 Tax=Brassica napus TaxID=3708 RepID=A0A078G5Y2_BRANA|nr:BnaC05g26160D [Brassica napus]